MLYMKPMSRRFFLGLASIAPAFSISTIFNFSKPFIVSLKCRSITDTGKEFDSVRDFWDFNTDKASREMHKKHPWVDQYMKRVSVLMDDKKTVQIHLIFKNRAAKELYTQIYRSYLNHRDNELTVEYFDKVFGAPALPDNFRYAA